MQKNTFLLYLLLLTVLIHSCTTTTTRTVSKSPAFNVAPGIIEDSLKKKIQFESVDINGLEITVNGKSKSVLEVNIFNGQKIPEDQNQINLLAEQIVRIVKQSMKDTGSYKTYRVKFENKEAKGLLTKEQVRTVEFSSEGK